MTDSPTVRYARIYGGIDSLGDDNADATCGQICSAEDQEFISEIGLHFLPSNAFKTKHYPKSPARPVGRCPASHSFPYGDPVRGEFCCSAKPVPTPPTEGCPKGATACCIKPGTANGCQGEKPCAVALTDRSLEVHESGMPKVIRNDPVVYTALDGHPSAPLQGLE